MYLARSRDRIWCWRVRRVSDRWERPPNDNRTKHLTTGAIRWGWAVGRQRASHRCAWRAATAEPTIPRLGLRDYVVLTRDIRTRHRHQTRGVISVVWAIQVG